MSHEQLIGFKKVAIAKEHASPENPGGTEMRVAMIPKDVGRLVAYGCNVSVETEAGKAMDYLDEEYKKDGANIESREKLYEDTDMVIKLKGPAHVDIQRMKRGSTLFCMAHVASIPEREQIAKERGINIIAMELIEESPEIVTDPYIRGRLAMYDMLKNTQDIPPKKLNLAFIGFSSEAFSALQYAARFDPGSLSLVNPTALSEHIRTAKLRNTLYVNLSESKKIGNREYETMRKCSAGIYDLGQSKQDIGNGRIEQYLRENPPKEYGKRRIQCLHETGRAGANYGIKLLLEESRKVDTKEQIKATVMGYGNVAFGTIDELYRQGIPQIAILTKRTTNPSAIGTYLRNSDIVVNGVEQPTHLRGKNYLVTKEHVQSTVQPGTVIVDLIGGSPTNRCAVETIINCTYPHNPFFVENNVYFTSLWGWPLMDMQRESVLRYSEQITDVLLSKEKLIKGLITAPKNVKSAIVTNTHQR